MLKGDFLSVRVFLRKEQSSVDGDNQVQNKKSNTNKSKSEDHAALESDVESVVDADVTLVGGAVVGLRCDEHADVATGH